MKPLKKYRFTNKNEKLSNKYEYIFSIIHKDLIKNKGRQLKCAFLWNDQSDVSKKSFSAQVHFETNSFFKICLIQHKTFHKMNTS